MAYKAPIATQLRRMIRGTRKTLRRHLFEISCLAMLSLLIYLTVLSIVLPKTMVVLFRS